MCKTPSNVIYLFACLLKILLTHSENDGEGRELLVLQQQITLLPLHLNKRWICGGHCMPTVKFVDGFVILQSCFIQEPMGAFSASLNLGEWKQM